MFDDMFFIISDSACMASAQRHGSKEHAIRRPLTATIAYTSDVLMGDVFPEWIAITPSTLPMFAFRLPLQGYVGEIIPLQ